MCKQTSLSLHVINSFHQTSKKSLSFKNPMTSTKITTNSKNVQEWEGCFIRRWDGGVLINVGGRIQEGLTSHVFPASDCEV